MYAGLLSVPEVLAVIDLPKSTLSGANLILYPNLNPRPSDVTDKEAPAPSTTLPGPEQPHANGSARAYGER